MSVDIFVKFTFSSCWKIYTTLWQFQFTKSC